MTTDTVRWHLAQLNVARIKYAIDDERMTEFVDNLDRINQLAEQSPGFVWRFEDDSGAAINTQAFDDPNRLLNLSVWESVDAFWGYVYKSDHAAFLRRRAEWFDAPGPDPYVVMWWVPAGHRPPPDEAVARLNHLVEHGPSPEAFSFRDTYDPPT